ncbi:MAG: glycosyltransferase [Patescibacteria group bacterium]|jgi:trehalose synthase|nr:glycosyltransferase [Patescibacteria group bacterium]
MLIKNSYRELKIEDYKQFLSDQEYRDILLKAEALKGKKIVYINSTPDGGGVAELLQDVIPLYRALGIDCQWYSFSPDEKLFVITKKLHNSLQGSKDELSEEERSYYEKYNHQLVEQVENLGADVLFLQDPQPLPLVDALSESLAISRIHIDITDSDIGSLEKIIKQLNKCQAVIFSSLEFVPSGLNSQEMNGPRVIISQPGINPLSEKNRPLSQNEAKEICKKVGIDVNRPFLLQVSRFDLWKDPLGVIEAYKMVKQTVSDIQLVLSGIIQAQDDPEAFEILAKIEKYAEKDKDIIVFSNLKQIEGLEVDTFINALQTRADVVLQKSLREGFGLTVTEAMWKKNSVIGGNVGGIKLQIIDGENGFLVNNVKEAVDKIIFILSHEQLKKEMGEKARERVRNKFLITRYLCDEIDSAIFVLNNKGK